MTLRFGSHYDLLHYVQYVVKLSQLSNNKNSSITCWQLNELTRVFPKIEDIILGLVFGTQSILTNKQVTNRNCYFNSYISYDLILHAFPQ